MRRSLQVRGIVVAVVAALVVCSSAAARVDSGARASSASDLPTVTIATAAFGISFFPIYLAQTLGYYQNAGVQVKFIDNAGANLTNYVVSGQADLGAIGVNGPILLTLRGKPMKVIYAHTGGASGGCLVGGAAITKLTQLDGKRIGHLGGGSSTQGFANIYDSVFKLGADLVPFGTNPAMVAALTAGSIQAGVASCSFFQSMIDAGTAHVLVNTRIAKVRHKFLGPDYPEGVIFGDPTNLAAKRTAVIAVLQAVDLGLRYLRTHSPADVAAALRLYPGYLPTPADTLASLVTTDALVYDGPDNGYVSSALWSVGLKAYGTWGLGIDPTAASIQYANFIDMSYLTAALNANRLPLTGSITAKGRVALRGAAGIASGRFAITVTDKSATDGFFIKGNGVKLSTGIASTKSVTWNVTLGAGTYTFGSVQNKKEQKTFTVAGL